MGCTEVESEDSRMTDTELLDVLQKLNDESRYTGLCVLRLSETGRGWRLHETSGGDYANPQKSVRQAIENFIKARMEAE